MIASTGEHYTMREGEMVKRVLLVAVGLFLVGCAENVMGPSPAPSPTPSAIPTPAVVACAAVDLESCSPASGASQFREQTEDAILGVRAAHPTWFGREVADNSWLILGPSGEVLPQDAIPLHFFAALEEALKAKGFCAVRVKDELAVSWPGFQSYDVLHVVIADKGPRTGVGPGMLKGRCGVLPT